MTQRPQRSYRELLAQALERIRTLTPEVYERFAEAAIANDPDLDKRTDTLLCGVEHADGHEANEDEDSDDFDLWLGGM